MSVSAWDIPRPGLRISSALEEFDDQTVASWEDRGYVPRDVLSRLARHGVFRERWEPGAEEGLPYLIAHSRETARRSAGLAVAVMGHSEMFIGGLTWLGAGAAQRTLLENAIDGRAIGCFAATEPHGGSSFADIRTTAVSVASGWRLRGCKRYVCNIGEATHVLVLARLEHAPLAGDLSMFIVPVGHAGVRVDGFFETAGLRACDVGQVTFDTVLPSDALLGRPGLGLAYASYLLSFERVGICAQLLATADLALRLAVSYARQREVGGIRVMDRQAIRHSLAGCQAELWNLESRLDELTDRARRSEQMPTREIAALKLATGQTAGRIVDACMQVFGARGYCEPFPFGRLWLDVRSARLGGGPDEVLADLVAAGIDRPDPGSDAVIASYIAAHEPRARRRARDDDPVSSPLVSETPS
jgi:alkylation response protein AidB-like acyl-CoA dehydrogenase